MTQMHLWLISLADETQRVQVKLCYPLTMRAIPERLRDALSGDAIQIDYFYLFPPQYRHWADAQTDRYRQTELAKRYLDLRA